MHLSEQARKRFVQLKRKFLRYTNVPTKRRSWRAMPPNEIWLRVFCQVVEVGRADPSTALRSNRALLRRVSYSTLLRLSKNDRRRAIHSVLREIGARYCSADAAKCRKTDALMSNFEVLLSHRGGPRGFIRDLMAIDGPEAAQRRIDFVTTHLRYIKNKGARDLLTTGLRVADEYLAFDVRWQKALRKMGLEVPPGTLNNPAKYAEFEAALITQVARPLKLSGKQLDQLIFNNYDAILRAP